jgi:hypothetical protein
MNGSPNQEWNSLSVRHKILDEAIVVESRTTMIGLDPRVIEVH